MGGGEKGVGMGRLKDHDITMEEWREYEFGGPIGSPTRITYRIANPARLYVRKGGTHHRVVDSRGVVHCVPAPGNGNCVLRWKVRKGAKSVAF